jgi:protein-disulfide isomerase
MSKQFWAVIIVIIIVLGGIFFITNNKSSSSSSNSSSNGQPSHHVEGEGKDDINLVEYGDYECPYCGEYFSTVKQIETEYNTEITFQFVNFPLVSIHQNAFAGARAAEAAALQGQFWQMHDLLYEENQVYYDSNETASTWVGASNPESYFDEYAKQLGLNVNEFEQDYASSAVNNTINADMAKGNKLGIDATPTFYLDGKQIQVDDSVTAFEKVINAAITAKGDTVPSTTAAAGASTSAGTTSQTTK